MARVDGLPKLSDLSDEDIAERYAPPRTPWFRINFVATVDGAAQGPDGLSGTINNPADKRVFRALRRLSDVVIAGAGTIRDEAYRPNPKPLVVVTRSGQVPPSLRAGSLEKVYVATGASAPYLAESRELLGDDHVWVLGELGPDLVALRRELEAQGWTDLLCEGGPHLTRDLFAAGVVDELCLTTVPVVIADQHLRVAVGPPVDVPMRLHGMIEEDSTLLARWFVER